MALEVCKKHPSHEATGHCPVCHVPVCPKDVVSEDGRIFCSEEHKQKFYQWENREKAIPKVSTQQSVIGCALKTIIPIVIIYLILTFFGILPPALRIF